GPALGPAAHRGDGPAPGPGGARSGRCAGGAPLASRGRPEPDRQPGRPAGGGRHAHSGLGRLTHALSPPRRLRILPVVEWYWRRGTVDPGEGVNVSFADR